MQTITQKKKTSTSFKILIIALLIGVLVAAITAVIGLWDATFLGDWLLGFYMWASASIVNALIISISLPFGGVFLCWAYFTYVRGNKTTVVSGIGAAGAYTPQTGASPATSSGTSTEVS